MIPLCISDSERFAELLECIGDAKEAMAEVEIRGMTPGNAIRHQNDIIVDLLRALEKLSRGQGTSPASRKKYKEANAAIAKARGEA